MAKKITTEKKAVKKAVSKIPKIEIKTVQKKTAAKKPTVKAPATPTKKVSAKKDAAKTLHDLFYDGLKDLYYAEKVLLKELPKMYKNASASGLKVAVNDHTKQTEAHIVRLEACFKSIGKKPQGMKCDAMDGLIKEAKGILEETKTGSVRDAGIIAAAQKVEHYEIASYGTLAAFAKVLGYKDALTHLLATLDEEKKCNDTLTNLADTELNTDAIKG